ncbi:chemotaxis protein CheC [Lachnospira eligens]|nr:MULTISPECIES: chemotaxis protein CheC [Clostridia]RGS32869.1 chemotaxis protein CheC [Eubacterium sp. AF22-9]UEA97195.1 chemotaxis protein CheC [Lachnospira eligens]HAS07022.1 chemotaxis protein CheC [Eubacterium sp.]HCO36464.1 chemotaxis protein CheC [Eubacterium sp.]
MSKIDLNQLNDIQYDVLREIGNIGAGNATTALSQMLNQKMDMSVPKVALVPFNEISDVMGSEDQTVVGIMLGFEGDVEGMMMFLFDTKSAHHLVNTLMMRDKEDGVEEGAEFSDMDMSALNEIGNIVSGSYLTAISKLTNLKMISTVPEMTIDMIGALLSVPASEFGKYGDKLLLIQSQFGELDFVNGYFLMIPELNSYDKLLESLGV